MKLIEKQGSDTAFYQTAALPKSHKHPRPLKLPMKPIEKQWPEKGLLLLVLQKSPQISFVC